MSSPSDAPSASRSSPRDLIDLVRLHLAALYHPGAGRAIVDRLGSAPAALRCPRARLLEIPGVTEAVASRLLARETEKLARDEVRRAAESGVRLLAWGAPGYPAPLASLPAMPLLLYARGRLEFPAEAVGIVGSRRPTPYGLRQARRFAGALAQRGLAIVSGLALGIDGEAHRAALEEGGRTIAVLGSGLARVYPPEHRDLAQRIARGGGVVVSELPLDTAPKSFHFPMRNRILSGLAAAVLVVEAGERSGSLITVNHALEQGKAVYTVPGRVDRPESLGCLRLLMDGAAPAIAPDDVLPGIGTFARARSGEVAPAPEEDVRPRLDGPFGSGLEALFAEEDVWHPDLIALRLGAPPARILAELSRLELAGRLRRLPGGPYCLEN